MPQNGFRRVVILASGGIDSTLLLQRGIRDYEEVVPLYVSCGFVWEKTELHWLRRILRSLRSKELKDLHIIHVDQTIADKRHWSLSGRDIPDAASCASSVYLPGRNVIQLSQASVFSVIRGISLIEIGLLKGNPFSDSTRPFLRRMAKTLSLGLDWNLTIASPLAAMVKKQVIQECHRRTLSLTFSCLNPQGRRHCRRCHKCDERQKGFAAAGLRTVS